MVHDALSIDCIYVFFEFKQLGILAYDLVECNMSELADLDNAIDSAHDKLV